MYFVTGGLFTFNFISNSTTLEGGAVYYQDAAVQQLQTLTS